ncbi:MAG: TIR domain-containing protein [Candidatus Binatia bacterium]
MAIRVLIADDQFPSDREEENRLVKQQLIQLKGEELRAKGKDPEAAVAEDRHWFEGLKEYLEIKLQYELVPARRFEEALGLIDKPDAFDVAVIDLSWTGDASLGTRSRKNIGMSLLERLYQQNSGGTTYKPVIALSQNYTEDAELVPLVVKKGALPVPKNYTPMGHQAIGGAIEYVSRHGAENEIKDSQHRDKIFLVHGHDKGVLNEVARFLEKLNQKVVILRELPNAGRTVIEKFGDFADVGYAVVLLTPDDRGSKVSLPFKDQNLRARQNVIFELGYFIGRLGRDRVTALYLSNVEIPSDYSGVLFTEIDDRGAWRLELARELKTAGFLVDLNLAM